MLESYVYKMKYLLDKPFDFTKEVLYGGMNCGKTMLSLKIIEEWKKQNPNGKVHMMTIDDMVLKVKLEK